MSDPRQAATIDPAQHVMLSRMPVRLVASQLIRYGFRAWGEPDKDGRILMLIPLAISDAVDPEQPVRSIGSETLVAFGDVKRDRDSRAGMLAYGVVAHEDRTAPGAPLREIILHQVRRALESAFPDQADQLLGHVERGWRGAFYCRAHNRCCDEPSVESCLGRQVGILLLCSFIRTEQACAEHAVSRAALVEIAQVTSQGATDYPGRSQVALAFGIATRALIETKGG